MSVLLLLGLARAATLTVGASGYATIQEAIDASVDGDEIVVDPGTWSGGIDLHGRAVTLRSRDGAASTTIDGGSSFWAVTLDEGEGADTVIADFTVANADGGGVYLVGASPTLRDLTFRGVGASGYATPALASYGGDPVVTGTTFEGNLAAYGGQTYVEGGTATFERCAWRDGVAYYGGAMFLTGGAQVSLTQSTFAGNEALFGGGAVYVVAGAGLVGSDVDFTDNVADTSHGGALYLEGSTTLGLTGGSFTTNAGASPTAYSQAGGAIFAGAAWMTLDGVAFTGNEALYGGAVAVSGGRLEVTDVRFDGNVGGYGGALSLDGGATLEDDGSTFTDNTASTHGGAVHAVGGWTASFTGTTFTANLAPNGYGGALYGQDGAPTLDGATLSENVAAYAGGAIQLDGLGAAATLRDTTFEGNVTTDGPGGAVYAVDGSPLVIDGGAFTTNAATEGGAVFAAYGNDVTVDGAVFSGNTAAVGGAIAHEYADGDAGALSLTASRFEGNVASAEGGAVASSAGAAVTITDAWFQGNTAGSGASGGAVFLTSPGAVTTRRTTFADNAAGYGGAVYVDGPTGDATFTNDLFVDNRAASGGAFCLAGGGSHAWTNNTFVGNGATQDGGVGCLDGAAATFVNNAIAYTRDGAALHEYDATAAAGTVFAYNAFYENAEGASTGVGANPSTATGTQTADPLFVAWTDNGDPTDDSFVLLRGSPLVDAGSPQIQDADGSPSDIGAWGGPEVAIADADADGYPAAVDCDESDPNVHPDATELWYDGVDQDCSGGSDYDADGDGVDGPEGGGDDCDDRDASVTTDCGGETGADSEQDTGDGGPKTDGAATGGGCGCGGSAPTGGVAGILLALVATRRRERR